MDERIRKRKMKSYKGLFDTLISDNNIKSDGHYDLKVENQRVEVKTACAETTFQHEPLYRANVCDIVIFIDICYNYIINFYENRR